MANMNRGRIGKNIYEQLERKGLLRDIKVLRIGKNAFEEKLGELYICTIRGYYYKNNSNIIATSMEGLEINNLYNDKLLVIYNDISSKIKKDDYFILDGTKYEIVDTGNIQNIIFDMILNRV
ncbi:hypothetical protein P9J83_16750 [Clostridium sporogenes]|uniref:Uncharacterized protein n=1 Tax=Clostridium sporogenes TaxID=1509 RepID=A0AAE4JTZ1_CLOSG|nr:hypothetical protein [Clostridium sporogenes]MDS1005125.1 hypothetical protein [Clostridium sporogenes]